MIEIIFTAVVRLLHFEHLICINLIPLNVFEDQETAEATFSDCRNFPGCIFRTKPNWEQNTESPKVHFSKKQS